VVDHEAEYDSVLVHFGESGYDDQVLGTARKLAARKRRGIHVLVTITVPNSMEIDAPMPEQEESAQSIIEEAKVAGGGRVSGHVERVRAGQAGRRIVEDAVDMRAAAIVMPLPRRVDGASLFGKTLETVLTERPCRVIIESVPDGTRRTRRIPVVDMTAATALLSAIMVVLGVVMIAITLSRGGGPDRGRHPVRRAVHPRGRRSPVGATPPVKRERRGMPQWQLGDAEGAQARAGLAGAVRDRPGLHRGVDLLRARAVIQAALGYAWIVFIVAAIFFGFVVLSYVEGASLHQERGGATIIARYAFNELASFVAGWAILLDYILLMAITAFATTDYVAVIFTPLSGGVAEFLFGAAVIVGVAWLNIRGAGSKRYERLRLRRGLRPDPADDDRDPRAADRAQPGRADQPGEPRRDAVGQGPRSSRSR
jgi:nucleotide-binding universal stress UspA family protein